MTERVNALAATQAILTQMAISSIPNQSVKASSTRKMAALFKRHVESLHPPGDR